MRTILWHKSGKSQANPKIPRNGTFGVVEMGGNGQMHGYAPTVQPMLVRTYLVDVK
jgi:hypothetical protein